jgi:hypothetical protein
MRESVPGNNQSRAGVVTQRNFLVTLRTADRAAERVTTSSRRMGQSAVLVVDAEHRGLRDSWKRDGTALDGAGSADGARGRNRTGMGLPPRDFRTRYSFRCCASVAHLESGLSLCRIARCARVRQGPSSLYTFRAGTLWQRGLARDCRHTSATVSPNLTPFARAFPIRVLKCLSPLRLPISPPGRGSRSADSSR